jgi:hypothetical protein
MPAWSAMEEHEDGVDSDRKEWLSSLCRVGPATVKRTYDS